MIGVVGKTPVRDFLMMGVNREFFPQSVRAQEAPVWRKQSWGALGGTRLPLVWRGRSSVGAPMR